MCFLLRKRLHQSSGRPILVVEVLQFFWSQEFTAASIKQLIHSIIRRTYSSYDAFFGHHPDRTGIKGPRHLAFMGEMVGFFPFFA